MGVPVEGVKVPGIVIVTSTVQFTHSPCTHNVTVAERNGFIIYVKDFKEIFKVFLSIGV